MKLATPGRVTVTLAALKRFRRHYPGADGEAVATAVRTWEIAPSEHVKLALGYSKDPDECEFYLMDPLAHGLLRVRRCHDRDHVMVYLLLHPVQRAILLDGRWRPTRIMELIEKCDEFVRLVAEVLPVGQPEWRSIVAPALIDLQDALREAKRRATGE